MLLLADQPSSDGVDGQGRLADPVTPDEIGRGDAVEQGAQFVLEVVPALRLDRLLTELIAISTRSCWQSTPRSWL